MADRRRREEGDDGGMREEGGSGSANVAQRFRSKVHDLNPIKIVSVHTVVSDSYCRSVSERKSVWHSNC